MKKMPMGKGEAHNLHRSTEVSTCQRHPELPLWTAVSALTYTPKHVYCRSGITTMSTIYLECVLC